ncbi:MAG TPA: cupin domain-containing protein [Opitutus sp.]|nr:cupin domain-containing protein [Opitutus sp.]
MKIAALLASFVFASVSLAASPPPPTDVVLLDHAKLDAAFVKGGSLLANARFKIMAGHREAPGAVEIHDHDTDILYILEGSATFVTNGTTVEPKTVEPGEIRAKAITGGVPHHLVKGDVIVIPKGIPHWFTEVNGPFLYFVVKTTD